MYQSIYIEMPKTSQSNRGGNQGLNPENYLSNFKEYEKGLRNGQETAASTDKKTRYGSSSRKVKIQ